METMGQWLSVAFGGRCVELSKARQIPPSARTVPCLFIACKFLHCLCGRYRYLPAAEPVVVRPGWISCFIGQILRP